MSAAMIHARTRLPPRAPLVRDPNLLVRADDGVPASGTTFGTLIRVHQSASHWTIDRNPVYRTGVDIAVSDMAGAVDFHLVLTTNRAPESLDQMDVTTISSTGTVQQVGDLLIGVTRGQFDDALSSLKPGIGDEVMPPLFLAVASVVAPGGGVWWSAHRRPLWN